MKYTKPNVLTTTKASAVIQDNEGRGKKTPLVEDHTKNNMINSTTGAYEADE